MLWPCANRKRPGGPFLPLPDINNCSADTPRQLLCLLIRHAVHACVAFPQVPAWNWSTLLTGGDGRRGKTLSGLVTPWKVAATMYGSRTPPDVVSDTGVCRSSRRELDSTCSPRSPAGGTRRIGDDHSHDYTVTTSLTSTSPVITSLSPLTSATAEYAASGRSPRTPSRHVEFLLDESATSLSSSSSSCRQDLSSGGICNCRPTDLDVGQQPASNWNARRRRTQSMIVIGEDDVDELFKPVNINGDSFALLQTPIRSALPISLFLPESFTSFSYSL